VASFLVIARDLRARLHKKMCGMIASRSFQARTLSLQARSASRIVAKGPPRTWKTTPRVDVEDHAACRHVRACRLEYDSFELKDIWFTSSRLRGEGEVAASIVKVSDDDPGTRLAAMR
jgi:hypothetical protein